MGRHADLSARRLQGDGDLALAIVLMFILGGVTVVTAPPTAEWLISYTGPHPSLPVARVVAQLVLCCRPFRSSSEGSCAHGRVGSRGSPVRARAEPRRSRRARWLLAQMLHLRDVLAVVVTR